MSQLLASRAETFVPLRLEGRTIVAKALFVLLGTLVLAAVGFTVRYLSDSRGFVDAQVPAFLGTVFGVHVMAVTGAVSGANFPMFGSLLNIEGPGFDDSLLVALATPAVSSGAIFAGLVAAIIAGWGTRDAK